MTTQHALNLARLSLPKRTLRAATGLALAAFVAVLATVAQGQTSEGTKPADFQPEKTVADYQSGVGQAAPQKDSTFDYKSVDLRTEVWVDKSNDDVYSKGEAISIGFETNQDAYAVVYRIDTEGLVTVLWPRSRFDDGFVFGGHEYQLPVSGARKLQVSTETGQGIVEAVVSRYPFDLRAIELDFHHENAAEKHNFRVAGDPFLAMNEVNFAVTGLEDAGEYVVTNYASYYVHQTVDHPRYLCSQCHLDDKVAYDPYRDECTLDIEYDYSWYNGWYDNYGYYPVYGNPVYVYIDPWTWNPWVNYWYTPYYNCAPWYGWGWGWGACYTWYDSPYYWGNCNTAYAAGYTRHQPLDRTRVGYGDGVATKTREYSRGSQMVRKADLSTSERGAMTDRRSRDGQRAERSVVASRDGSRQGTYRGSEPAQRSRTEFDQAAAQVGNRGGLRIRETGRTTIRGGDSGTGRVRHTAAGEGRTAGLVPVQSDRLGSEDWRGTTRVGGAATGRGSAGTGTTVGNSSRLNGGEVGGQVQENSRSRTSAGSKAVQPRKRSTRVWNSGGGRQDTSSDSNRSRSGAVNNRGRSDTGSSGSRDSVAPRKESGSSKDTGRSSSSVKPSGKSTSRSGSSTSGSRGGGGSSRGGSGSGSGNSSGGSRGSGGSSGSSRR